MLFDVVHVAVQLRQFFMGPRHDFVAQALNQGENRVLNIGGSGYRARLCSAVGRLRGASGCRIRPSWCSAIHSGDGRRLSGCGLGVIDGGGANFDVEGAVCGRAGSRGCTLCGVIGLIHVGLSHGARAAVRAGLSAQRPARRNKSLHRSLTPSGHKKTAPGAVFCCCFRIIEPEGS